MNGDDRQVVLVTGASRGIGWATVRQLHAHGHVVYAAVRDRHGRNAEAAASLTALGDRMCVIELDVRDQEACQRAVDVVIAATGRIDTVVNNAGIMNVGVAEGFTVPQLLEQMNVNYLGPARMFRAALPAMRAARRGLFVTVSSLAGRLLFPFLSTYNPSKFAVEALAEIYRYELRPFGIDSVIVEPGPFLTGLIDAAPRPADAARVEAYGELGAGAEMAMTGFKQMMADNPKHDPGIVAADIVRLIEAPFGTRPLRTLSGDTYGVERINEAAAAVQRELLTVMGLAHLDPGAEVPA